MSVWFVITADLYIDTGSLVWVSVRDVDPNKGKTGDYIDGSMQEDVTPMR